MNRKIITILTDFGKSDPYVAIMKGVITSIFPDVNIIDLSHNIPKYDILKGALILDYSGKYFPKDTIHLVVIDPGVGSKRLPILIKTKKYYLIGPDNGVLSLLALNDGIERIISLENPEFFLDDISETFHGRDIFAPVAAYTAKGIQIDEFGKEVDKINKLNEIFYSKGDILSPSELNCYVINVDNFGNIITNIEKDLIYDMIKNLRKENHEMDIFSNVFLKITKGSEFNEDQKLSKIDFPFKKTYSKVEKNQYLSLIGSHGNLEFAKNQGNASSDLKIRPKTKLCIKILI
jgi:hypothetical protein